MSAVQVWVNGTAREVAEGTTVSELLRALGRTQAEVAVERNQRLVPRTRHAETRLAEGDRLEIVTLVGGG